MRAGAHVHTNEPSPEDMTLFCRFCFHLKMMNRLLLGFACSKINQFYWTFVSRNFTDAHWALLGHLHQSFNSMERRAIVQKTCFVKTLQSGCFTVSIIKGLYWFYSVSNLNLLQVVFFFPTLQFNNEETKFSADDYLWFIFLSSCSFEYIVCRNPQNLFSSTGLSRIKKDGVSQWLWHWWEFGSSRSSFWLFSRTHQKPLGFFISFHLNSTWAMR